MHSAQKTQSTPQRIIPEVLHIDSNPHRCPDVPRDITYPFPNLTSHPVETFPETCTVATKTEIDKEVCRICVKKFPNNQCTANMHSCCVCMQEFHAKTWPDHAIKKPQTLSETDARMHKVQRARLHGNWHTHIPVQSLRRTHGAQDVLHNRHP